jgi:hypothetical protein
MSYFYGSVNSSMRKKPATARGGKEKGITAHVRTWTRGIEVEARHDEKTGEDIFEIYVTSGSNGDSYRKHLQTIRETV